MVLPADIVKSRKVVVLLIAVSRSMMANGVAAGKTRHSCGCPSRYEVCPSSVNWVHPWFVVFGTDDGLLVRLSRTFTLSFIQVHR